VQASICIKVQFEQDIQENYAALRECFVDVNVVMYCGFSG
jgi:hypothetical protein